MINCTILCNLYVIIMLCILASDSGSISQIAMYGYGEHKRLMMWRLRELCEQKSIAFPKLAAACEKTEKTTKWLVTASMKYNLAKSTELLNSIVCRIREQNELERVILEKFLALVDDMSLNDSK